MQSESGWQPVAPSHYLRAGENIVAGFMEGGELALWRSADGAAQAWENRCPHRGTRLTLGRIIDGRLSCAYHGWEFSADGGRCASIPAHPSMSAPKNLCATTYAVREGAGMVWVCKGAVEEDAPQVASVKEVVHFCRSLGLSTSEARVADELRKLRFELVAPRTWSGDMASRRCTVFLNAGSPVLTFAHVWLASKSEPAQIRLVLTALARLRERAEQPQPTGSAT